MNSNIQDEIIESIQLIVKRELAEAPFNKLVDGLVMERTGDLEYTVQIANKEYFNIQPLNIKDSFEEGDIVYILIRNNNFSDKKILGTRGEANRKKEIKLEELPTFPVHIIRENNDPKGKVFRFDYGFEGFPIEKTWSQVLHRDLKNKVFMITHHYFDGSSDYFYLLRNEAERVHYYGRNSKFLP